MGIVFILSVVATHAIFDNIYVTCGVSLGILFIGYMGYVTYTRDQERKAMDRINDRLHDLAGEMAAKQAHPGKKNGRP